MPSYAKFYSKDFMRVRDKDDEVRESLAFAEMVLKAIDPGQDVYQIRNGAYEVRKRYERDK